MRRWPRSELIHSHRAATHSPFRAPVSNNKRISAMKDGASVRRCSRPLERRKLKRRQIAIPARALGVRNRRQGLEFSGRPPLRKVERLAQDGQRVADTVARRIFEHFVAELQDIVDRNVGNFHHRAQPRQDMLRPQYVGLALDGGVLTQVALRPMTQSRRLDAVAPLLESVAAIGHPGQHPPRDRPGLVHRVGVAELAYAVASNLTATAVPDIEKTPAAEGHLDVRSTSKFVQSNNSDPSLAAPVIPSTRAPATRR